MVGRAADISETDERPGTANYDALAGYLKVLGNAKRIRLLHFLTEPHYLEEIASELRMARQTAQEHVQQLLDIGVVQRIRGRRDHGPVTDYAVVPHRLFSIYEEFGKLGVLEPDIDPQAEMRPATTPLQTGIATPRTQDLPRLILVHGMRIGLSTTLAGNGPWMIGRDPAASVCLDYDPYASTRHAEVRRVPGGYEVADLYSSNGTYLDWNRLPRGGTAKVDNGHLVRVGKTLLLFRKPTL